jgi:hypothetical protein
MSNVNPNDLGLVKLILFRFFNLSKLIDHANIVSCLGYVNVLPGRTLLVSEYSRLNLYEYCQTLVMNDQETLP